MARSLGMSLREFDRLPDLERSLWIAEYEREQATCGECGRPIAECSDPEREWYPFRTVCFATQAQAAHQARYERLHEKAQWHNGIFTSWSERQTDEHPFHRDAGVRIGVAERDLHPWDDFTREPDASPIPPDPDEED
ncbi:hypothetical protein [Nocardioides sp.]|uniref:hypothetical protein n=1 Tax=Nocardioides sp. TaxID=35761 RepID=UPI0035124ECD